MGGAVKRIETSSAPGAIGPYSQGIAAGNLVFTAGQIGLDPETGDLVEGLEGQTRRALANVGAILAAAGCAWRDVVKTTVFLADMADFAAFNAIYAEVVSEPYPARATVQAAGLPKGALIEIDAVAVKGG
jgi:2-iminobutanoate/2-iminopropanoate deaminase